jgi:hypothetical protein
MSVHAIMSRQKRLLDVVFQQTSHHAKVGGMGENDARLLLQQSALLLQSLKRKTTSAGFSNLFSVNHFFKNSTARLSCLCSCLESTFSRPYTSAANSRRLGLKNSYFLLRGTAPR